MVHIVSNTNELEIEESHGNMFKKLSAHVRCPVCLQHIVVSKADNYFLLSNVHKHIRVHLKETAKEKPKQAKRYRNKLRKVTMSGSTNRSSRSKTETEKTDSSSTDSDGTDKISEEMLKDVADVDPDVDTDSDDVVDVGNA